MSSTSSKIIVKSFSGATTKDMMDYIKPIVRRNPDHIVVHVGTNDLSSSADETTVANNITSICDYIEKELCYENLYL